MFDNLVESQTNTKEVGKQASYLGITTVIYGALFLALFVWSLYSFDLGGMGSDDLVLDTLVAPVPVPEPEPPPPPDQPKEQPKTTDRPTKENVDLLRDPTLDINMTPTKPPEKIETGKQQFDAIRRNVAFAQSDKTSYAEGGSEGAGRTGGTVNVPPPPPVTKATPAPDNDEPPPPPPPKPSPTPKPVPKTISGGVVNSKATNLVKPPYPPAARAVNASGAVNVQVTIDENGSVVSAAATSGHPLLRDAAVRAARSSKFSPTLLSGQPVKVTGVIVYNFTP